MTAKIHKDSWYSDTNGQGAGDGRRQPGAGLGLPRPLIGTVIDPHGEVQFGIVESSSEESDGGSTVQVNVSFFKPAPPAINQVGIPLLSLAPTVGAAGTLAGGQTLYYSIRPGNVAG